MKYVVLDEIYNLEKNNGETFKVNKIKWRNTSKYDMRIWREDTPMQGITLSGEELSEFCKNLLTYQGVSSISNFSENDFAVSGELSDIDLGAMLSEHPECLRSSSKFRAMLKDYFPGKDREVNILWNLFDCGIDKTISKLQRVEASDIQKYLNTIENSFGVKSVYTLWGIKTWADAYNIPCDSAKIKKQINTMPNPSKKQQNTPPKPKSNANIYCVNDDLVNDGDIQITYKGLLKGYPGSYCPKFVLYLKNKTRETAYVAVENLEINDFRVRTYGEISLAAGMQAISKDISTQLDDIKMLGISSANSIKTIKMTLLYKTHGILKSKVLNIEAKEY